MYTEPVIKISPLDDGMYSIEMCLRTPTEKKGKSNEVYSSHDYNEKIVTASTTEEVINVVKKYLPGLAKAQREDKEDGFEKAFEKYCKEEDKD